MNRAQLSSSLPGIARVVLVYQAVITVAVAALFFVLQGGLQALSALYGGLITLMMTVLLRRRVVRLTEVAGRRVAVNRVSNGLLILNRHR